MDKMKKPMREPKEKVYDGSGYDGSQDNYDPASDPFLEGVDPDELAEYQSAREAVLGKPEVDTTPTWVKDLIAANKH